MDGKEIETYELKDSKPYRRSSKDVIVTGKHGFFEGKKITIKGFSDEDLIQIKQLVNDDMKNDKV